MSHLNPTTSDESQLLFSSSRISRWSTSWLATELALHEPQSVNFIMWEDFLDRYAKIASKTKRHLLLQHLHTFRSAGWQLYPRVALDLLLQHKDALAISYYFNLMAPLLDFLLSCEYDLHALSEMRSAAQRDHSMYDLIQQRIDDLGGVVSETATHVTPVAEVDDESSSSNDSEHELHSDSERSEEEEEETDEDRRFVASDEEARQEEQAARRLRKDERTLRRHMSAIYSEDHSARKRQRL